MACSSSLLSPSSSILRPSSFRLLESASDSFSEPKPDESKTRRSMARWATSLGVGRTFCVSLLLFVLFVSLALHFSLGPGSVSPEWIALRKLGPALSAQPSGATLEITPAANDDEAYKKNVARFSNKTKTHHTLDASPERKNLSKARLPDLLLIGVQKGGSTAVTEWLFEEGVCGATPFQDGGFSSLKELHFFDAYERFRLGKSEYLQHFKHCVGKKTRFTMDATPDSFWYPEHVYEVYKDDPDLDRLKIIVLLREPIARELSLYNHMRNLWSKDPDPKAWYRRVSTESFPEFAKKKLRDGADYKSYYAQYLSRWFQFFDPQQILVLSYEHEVLPGTPAKQRIGDFLGHSFRDDKGAFPRVNEQSNPNKIRKVPCSVVERARPTVERWNKELYELLATWKPHAMDPFPKFEIAACVGGDHNDTETN
mmetsp:Transcript_12135/g.33646  ORF Transcript_12135/g.33646 Transcript_12135/m.33646 type:complete len:426 (-) Transcript_12135:402-1679(-)